MADAAIGIVTETVLKMVVSLAAEGITLAWGMKEELGKLGEKLEMIQALLHDAQTKQITDRPVLLWLKELRSISFEAQILLEEFEYEALRHKIKSRKRDKVRAFFSSSNPLSFRSQMARKIKDVLSSLEQVYAEAKEIGLQPTMLGNSPSGPNMNRLTVPYVEDSEIVGRDDDISKVISMLIGTEYKEELPVITILGMGGQGKTTLAQLVYKNDTIKSHFQKLVWICVSDNFSVERLLAEMWKSLDRSDPKVTNVEALVNKLKEHLRDTRYLLVLDDVWNDKKDEWDQMRSCLIEIGGSKESRILATTRDQNIASVMRTPKSGLHPLGILSEEKSWELFEKCAFAEGGPVKTPQLIDMGERIIRRCGGVPLAIRAVGGMLYSKSSEAEWSIIERSDIWSLNNEGKNVISIIELSYHNLPSLELKQCFAYCSIFEKDALIEKDVLIQLWMAQGLLNSSNESGLQMEDLGDMFFNILLRSSLLQTAEKDKYRDISYYKMHDLVHDVSSKVIQNYTCHVKEVNVERSKIDAMHVSVYSREKVMWKSLSNILPSKLRTLYLQVDDFDAYEDLFKNLQCLSVLIIEDWGLKELPNTIGKMKHLKYLDIRRTRITRFPDGLTKLFLLQTLRLEELDEDLPEGFGNLVNLKLVHIIRVTIRITKMRNLQNFCSKYQTVVAYEECKIGELEQLNDIKDEIQIQDLPKMRGLELRWGHRRETKEEECDDCNVMEGLKPHLNLKFLRVEGYLSPKLASWMGGAENDFFLRNLVELRLWDLKRCERLPSLGDLQFLHDLNIRSLEKVKCIGEEFYGLENLKRRNGCNESAEIILFPALRSFQVVGMKSLEEWIDPTTTHTSSSVKVFPFLKYMHIGKFPKLRVLPNFGSLPRLQRLKVIGLNSGPPEFHQNYFPSLNSLEIHNCSRFTSSFCSPLFLPTSVPLKTLSIECSPQLWPEDLYHLTNLRQLRLIVPYDMEELDIDGLPWPYPDSTTNSVLLTSLSLQPGNRLPKVASLPHQIQYVTTLQKLEIFSFQGLEFLPEWLGNLECLQELNLYCCPKLKLLPSQDVFQRLTNLQSLTIRFCAMLEKECEERSGSEWPKIAHIPKLLIGWKI